MNFVRLFLKNFKDDISEDAIKIIEKLLTPKEFKKGEVIVDIGDKNKNFYIVTSGIIRSYITDQDGKEYIKGLYRSPHITGPLSSIIKEKRSNTIYDCLTDCNVLVGNLEEFIILTKENLELALFNNRVLEKVFLEIEDRIRSLTILDATDRYLKVLKDFPGIENLIPQYHIAAYLNITNVQLSRIRKKLLES